MKVKSLSRVLTILMLLGLLATTAVFTASAQTPVAASSVRGELNEQGSKHYLGLKVLDPTKQVKVVMDYRQDSSDLDGGSGFLLFDEQTFRRYISGETQVNLAAGALDSSSGLKQKVAIIADPIGTFSAVVFNDTGIPLDYTLTAENALIVDDSGEQVRNASAAPSTSAGESAAEEATEEAAATSTPAASTAVTSTATATATPVARSLATPVIAREASLQGDLEEQFDKHYFDLAVADIGSNVNLTLAYDPQDQPNVDNGFNVWVYSTEQFRQMILRGQTPSQATNTAAGTLTTKDGLKTMEAIINTPFRTYTVIVANDSTIPVSYTLTVDNGLLVDASGQTNTAQALMAAAGSEEEESTGTGTTTTTTERTTDPTVSAGTVYVVKAGDTIATIARAAYGDVNLWDELCAFNQIENCDRIEVGQEIIVPAASELGTGAVAAPVTAATPAPVATTAATTTTAPVTTTTTTTATTTAPATTASGTIIDVATNARQFEILLLALSLANLTDGLKGAGPFTLFAPADAAFASLPEKTLDSLLADTAQLGRVLQFHVVPQQLSAANITNGMTVTTLMGQQLTLGVADGKITVNGANVVGSELPAGNGSVFTIDAVLLPAQ